MLNHAVPLRVVSRSYPNSINNRPNRKGISLSTSRQLRKNVEGNGYTHPFLLQVSTRPGTAALFALSASSGFRNASRCRHEREIAAMPPERRQIIWESRVRQRIQECARLRAQVKDEADARTRRKLRRSFFHVCRNSPEFHTLVADVWNSGEFCTCCSSSGHRVVERRYT